MNLITIARTIGVTAGTAICSIATTATRYDTALDSYIRDMHVRYDHGIRVAEAEFDRFLHRSEEEFVNWCRQQQRELAAFRRHITDTWGYFWEPSGKLWVEYGGDSSSVSVVDFQSGMVTVEVLVGRNEPGEKMRHAIQEALTRTVTSSGSPHLVPLATNDPRTAKNRSVLSGQVLTHGGATVDSSNVDQFVASLLPDTTISAITSARAATHKKVRVSFSLVPDHLRRRMMPLVPIVRRYCSRYGLRVSRVLATIHTESCFNPVARSNRNAIGLMQLVPHTAGVDAYRAVYGKNVVPTAAYLYNPEQNIELGCAYIYLLKHRYFREVRDADSRLYCTIAAYNTGPGNVAYAFTGRRAMRAATRMINTMKDAKSVYDHMIGSLPFAETRHYLAFVIERMDLYATW